MMSLRTVARSAPRTLSRLSARSTTIRSSSSALKMATPYASASAWRPATAAYSAFSTSAARRAAAPASSEVDEELSAKLDSEIQFETEVKENEPQPTSVKDFLESGLFEIEDTPGQERVVLKRTHGNEKITISFSIADLANYDPESFEEDSALADEDLDRAGGGAQGSGNRAADIADEDLEGAGSGEAAVPCRLTIVVEKPGAGALNIEATAQDGNILVDNLYYYREAALAHGASADAAHRAQDVYPGPPFGSLDEDLQVLMERYLEERGVTQALAVFVPDYMDMKEQREYLAWLNNLKTFVDA